MMENGLLEEVKSLYEKKIHSNSVQAIGYKELYAYFKNECSLEEAVDKIKQKSRNLAKKQFTFFNNQFDCSWVDVDLHNFENTFKKVINIIENR